MRYLEFAVHGKPAQKGSARAMIHNRSGEGGKPPIAIMLPDNRKALRSWEGVVRTAAMDAADDAAKASGQPWTMLTAPCCVVLDFTLERPKSRKLEVYPAVMPDIDKLTRAVLDALQSTVIEDDKLVARLLVEKRYCGKDEPPGVFVRVQELPAMLTDAWKQAVAALLLADDDEVAGF